MQIFICTGNLTKDVELRETPNGKSVATLSIAVNRPFSNDTDFFNITVWNKQAENCAKFLKKGNKVAIIGSIQNRQYTADDGTKRTVTEIQADTVEFLTPKDAGKPERQPLEELKDNQLPFES